MGNVLSGSEIAELGVQIEINGKDFYDTLTLKAKDKKAKETFKYLAGEEEKHIEKFKHILNSIRKYEPKEAYPQEYFSYMNSLASNHVFTQKNKGKEIAAKIKGEREAIDLGIKFEKDSVTFYEGMKKIMPKEDIETINTLIHEENNHITKLVLLKDMIQFKER